MKFPDDAEAPADKAFSSHLGFAGYSENMSEPDGSLDPEHAEPELIVVKDRFLKRIVEERDNAQAEMLHAQKMEAMGQLASGMAHEINTPLQYIGGNLEFMAQAFDELSQAVALMMNALEQAGVGHDPLQQRQKKIEFILTRLPNAISQSREGVDNVGRIVRAMRRFSHPSDQPVESDINEAIESTLIVSKGEWKYIADIDLQLDSSLPKFVCLPGELNQGFLNMIVNAAHAIQEKLGKDSDQKGTISISTSFDEECIQISIGDSGSGIPEKVLHRIFEQFFTTKEIGRGTGQGLAICHSIFVGKHKGDISVQSEVGKGTTFSIKLPRTDRLSEKGVIAE